MGGCGVMLTHLAKATRDEEDALALGLERADQLEDSRREPALHWVCFHHLVELPL